LPVFFVISILAGSYGIAEAVPAAPVVHTLIQPDGTSFKARQWGDENSHGWETADGYTIVFDKTSQRWVYAIKDQKGHLIGTAIEVGRANEAVLQKHIRPVRGPIVKRLKREGSPFLRTFLSSQALAVGSLTAQINIPVILINFNDTTTTFNSSDFNTLLFGTGNSSLKDYYQEVSYGNLTVNGTVYGWVTASYGHDYYGTNDAQGWDQHPGDLVYEAVQAADSTVDFSQYDSDGDCYVDVVVVVHQGQGEEASDNPTDIWSHRWSLSSAYAYGYSNWGAYITNDPCSSNSSQYVIVDDYTLQPELLGSDMTTVGVFAHELGHVLGLPDLYDTDASSEGIGQWSLMAAGAWNFVSLPGDSPAHLDAWSKYFLGWITPQHVTATLVNHAIASVETTADVYLFLNGSATTGEYFLIANRQRIGFDQALPAGGLLVWHIDTDVINANLGANTVNAEECYPPGPSCAQRHYGVSLVQADGLWQLEKGVSSGDGGDPFPGSTGNSNFHSFSTPASLLWDGTYSGVYVKNISVQGQTIYADMGIAPVLSITKTGSGYGTVKSTPSGINCGNSCSSSFELSETVSLTAIANSGSYFSRWGGDCASCATSSTCTIAMDSSKSCSAVFELEPSGGGGGCVLGGQDSNFIDMSFVILVWILLLKRRLRTNQF